MFKELQVPHQDTLDRQGGENGFLNTGRALILAGIAVLASAAVSSGEIPDGAMVAIAVGGVLIMTSGAVINENWERRHPDKPALKIVNPFIKR